jgi:hypothetical protein
MAEITQFRGYTGEPTIPKPEGPVWPMMVTPARRRWWR